MLLLSALAPVLSMSVIAVVPAGRGSHLRDHEESAGEESELHFAVLLLILVLLLLLLLCS